MHLAGRAETQADQRSSGADPDGKGIRGGEAEAALLLPPAEAHRRSSGAIGRSGETLGLGGPCRRFAADRGVERRREGLCPGTRRCAGGGQMGTGGGRMAIAGSGGGGGTTPPGPPLVLVRCGRFHPYLYMSVCHYGYKEIINDYPYLYRVLYSVQVTGTGYLVRMYHGSLNAGTDRRNETGR